MPINLYLNRAFTFTPKSMHIYSHGANQTRIGIMKIAINRIKSMRGKGFEPLNSCENRS